MIKIFMASVVILLAILLLVVVRIRADHLPGPWHRL